MISFAMEITRRGGKVWNYRVKSWRILEAQLRKYVGWFLVEIDGYQLANCANV